MPDWRLWRDMARSSLKAAQALEGVSVRASISRYYYAAYQAVTAVLHYHGGLTPPEGREAWKHTQTPLLMQAHFQAFIRSTKRLNSMVSDLTYLYKLRVYADYVSATFETATLKAARTTAIFLISACEGVMQQGVRDEQ